MQHVYASQQLIYALTHAQVLIQTHYHHNTLVIHFLHKCSVSQLSLYTCALLLPIPTPIANCCFRVRGCPVTARCCGLLGLAIPLSCLSIGNRRLGWAPGQAGKAGRRLAHTLGTLVCIAHMGCSQLGHLGLALSALSGEVFLSLPLNFKIL